MIPRSPWERHHPNPTLHSGGKAWLWVPNAKQWSSSSSNSDNSLRRKTRRGLHRERTELMWMWPACGTELPHMDHLLSSDLPRHRLRGGTIGSYQSNGCLSVRRRWRRLTCVFMRRQIYTACPTCMSCGFTFLLLGKVKNLWDSHRVLESEERRIFLTHLASSCTIDHITCQGLCGHVE